MTATTLFYIIISILIISFIIDKIIGNINAKHFDDALPLEVADVYEEKEYSKSQSYKKINFKLGTLTSLFSIVLTLLFFFLNGFEFVDTLARNFSDNPTIIALIFFGIIMIASDVLTTPFSYYKTFVIEEKFGFNKATKKIFWMDKIKGWLMSIVLGG